MLAMLRTGGWIWIGLADIKQLLHLWCTLIWTTKSGQINYITLQLISILVRVVIWLAGILLVVNRRIRNARTGAAIQSIVIAFWCLGQW